MPFVTFDIETGPLDLPRLKSRYEPYQEFTPLPELQPFDPSSVKTGNLKDEAKIAEKIEAARRSHEDDWNTKAIEHATNYEVAKERHWQKFVDNAALHAETARVLVIGYQRGDKKTISCESSKGSAPNVDGEPLLIENFWGKYRRASANGVSLVGHNIFGFDLPFLLRRSWILGVDIPDSLTTGKGYWSWDSVFIDTMTRWGCGARNEMISLDGLARVFGIPGKIGFGADFARLWSENREEAIEYLENDLRLTTEIARRMGVR